MLALHQYIGLLSSVVDIKRVGKPNGSSIAEIVHCTLENLNAAKNRNQMQNLVIQCHFIRNIYCK